MPSVQAKIIKLLLRVGMRNSFRSSAALPHDRARSEKRDRLALTMDRNFSRRDEMLGSVPSTWILTPDSDPGTVLLYFHGGGLCLRTPAVHGQMLSRLCAESGAAGLMPDYRLAPEDPFPAAYHDGLAVYRWLLDHGYDPAKLVMAGDSAGGALTIGTLLTARDLGLPLPACGLLLSPAIGAMHHPQLLESAKEGVLLSYRNMMTFAEAIAAHKRPEHPLAELTDLDYSGFPPLLFQVGGDEILLEESINSAARAEEAGVAVELQVFRGMMHVFPIFSMLPESHQAVSQAGEFLRKHLKTVGN